MQTIAWLFPHVCFCILMRKRRWCESPCADTPASTAGSGSAAWKVIGSEWKMILQRCLTPVISLQRCHSGTFSHAVQKEEGFIYRLSWDPFAFVRAAIHWERGRDSPSAIKTHKTKRKNEYTPEKALSWKRGNQISRCSKDIHHPHTTAVTGKHKFNCLYSFIFCKTNLLTKMQYGIAKKIRFKAIKYLGNVSDISCTKQTVNLHDKELSV